MRKITEGLGCRDIVAVATSAVRKAANGPEFVTAMQAETGIPIQVIDGEEEAELAALSARHHFEMASARYGLLDIGGGSVEVVMATGDHIEEIFSLDLGRGLPHRALPSPGPDPREGSPELREAPAPDLRRRFLQVDTPLRCLIGSGGTITAIAAMVMAQRHEPYRHLPRLRGAALRGRPPAGHAPAQEPPGAKHVPGLSPDRADIIVAGVAAVDALMRSFGTNHLRINERGIREGLIIRLP